MNALSLAPSSMDTAPTRRGWPNRAALLAVAMFVLAACSGGNGTVATPATPVVATPVDAVVDGGTASIRIQAAPAGPTVDDGESATLVVVASGPTPLNYQWHRDGVPVEGAKGPIHVTPALTLADSGTRYSVVVSHGNDDVTTAPVPVTVRPVAPQITSQPQPQTVTAGQSATFSVLARGSAPLHYQWQRDGVDIPGADAASFTTTASGSAELRVVVSNAAGSVTSDAATLSTTAAGPVVRATTTLGLGAVGQRIWVAFALSGQPPFVYQWLRNGVAIDGAAGTTDQGVVQLITPPLRAEDDGMLLSLVVANGKGVTRSSAALVTVVTSPQVAAGRAHSLARSADGATVWAWGDNSHGQLGLGSSTAQSRPTVISGLTGVTAIAAGAGHSLALMADGTVRAWGRNASGSLGDGTRTDRASPQPVPGISGAVAVAAAGGSSFALLTNGSLWSWGDNATGALGIGSLNEALAPTPVVGNPSFPIVAMAAGERHTLALLAGGQVLIFGEIAAPESNRPSTLTTPAPVEGLGDIAAIAAGAGHALALDANGRLFAWGPNDHGQLGLGNSTPHAVPLQVEQTADGRPLLPAQRLAAAGQVSLLRTLDGALLSWGSAANGQLGTGSTTSDALAPQTISKLPVATVGVAAGHSHVLAVRDDGSVYAWGSNASGQLGIGTGETLRTEPVQIPGLRLN